MSELKPRMDRREAIKWMLAATSTAVLADAQLFGQPAGPGQTEGQPGGAASSVPDNERVGIDVVQAKGYGSDPDLLKTYKPGDLWPLTFNEGQRAAAAALCDTIIPVDGTSAGAAQLGVHDFIDEWISAPYPAHHRDRQLILGGLAWIDAESTRRFGLVFADLIMSQRHAILDDICYEPRAEPQFKDAARFFKRYRDLTAGGFYTTPEGMKDLQYVGNVPLEKFEGPPPELIKRLGLDEAVQPLS
jgi:hypothetical protein